LKAAPKVVFLMVYCSFVCWCSSTGRLQQVISAWSVYRLFQLISYFTCLSVYMYSQASEGPAPDELNEGYPGRRWIILTAFLCSSIYIQHLHISRHKQSPFHWRPNISFRFKALWKLIMRALFHLKLKYICT